MGKYLKEHLSILLGYNNMIVGIDQGCNDSNRIGLEDRKVVGMLLALLMEL